MKRLVLTSAALVCAASLSCTGERKHESSTTAALDRQSPPATLVHVDPVAVFQSAFWKRPFEGDRILHAERREWSDQVGGSVQKWQWFLVVEPSAALVRYLRDENAFALVPAAKPAVFLNAPTWFAVGPGTFDTLEAPSGNMRLMFSKSGDVLYATDAGGGFHPGTPEKMLPSPSPAVPAGDLPTTPPPNPVLEAASGARLIKESVTPLESPTQPGTR